MRINVGCELTFEFTQETPLIAILNVHHSRFADLEGIETFQTTSGASVTGYHDQFGNWCNRILAAPGTFFCSTNAIVRDSGLPDPVVTDAVQHRVQDLPDETLVYLMGSRYCETDLLSEEAWRLFGHVPEGWQRVQAICDFVHNHIVFGYEHSNPTRTASSGYYEGRGVCRDYTHLAVAFSRCLNIPTRYCTGYITDIGIPLPHAEMDFCAWMEVYLGGQWHAFDPRNNRPRIGRIKVAHGRDAADVPLTNVFGPNVLTKFKVWAKEAV
ncbi:transglutaminase-like domain-containing protein [Phyllobacterium endophyticum]|uniref:Transglutaminase n=1 Tax=Phyllobacterium endophyticum TaxID=1149773 RepID=A0A2P7AYP2_9HYPH|nr:transglutaminase family protein [Phyllobacterium endophyticum]MBB3236116.1 transglutaminase-like putative cysteine protease [Phyllobacterium endophyticum]PSH59328.1 transglutaminase [Phyllobacterium endophyticum]TXR49165.1 transglutaminase family protein [Phyllobacterium endophyticum]TYR41454.1 transglutaminase family protein [Phyllobacterium endophyticum]